MPRSLAITYAIITLALGVYFAVVGWLVQGAPSGAVDPRELLPSIFVLASLTAAALLLAAIVRNVSVATQRVSMRYYQTYGDDAPPEWIERPARTYMNLLEMPVLFYVACLLMLTLGHCDRASVLLANLFVATRVAHAIVYIGVNHVPTRFAAFLAGGVTLGVLWARLASQLL